MATLKSLAQARGVWLGAGPADPSVPTGPAIWVWPTVPPGYVWSNPAALDAATDPYASLVVNEFGGALDICVWARGPLDLSHWGKFERWLGPGSYDFDGPDQTYAWALANGLRVWVSDPAYSGVPAWLADWYDDGIDAYYIKNPAYSAADITNLLQAWYTAVFSRYPQIYATTLLNELRGGTSRWNVGFYYEHSSVGAAGGKTVNEFAATICSWVRAANPNVKIVPNDFGIEWNLANAQVQRDWILALNALGAGIADVGLQCHAGTTGTPDWTVFRQVAAMFKAAGLTPHVTEFDVKGSTASTFGAGIRAMLDSGITTINFWSIKDPMYTGTTGALYDTNLQPKAARAAVEEALTPPIALSGAAAGQAGASAPVTQLISGSAGGQAGAGAGQPIVQASFQGTAGGHAAAQATIVQKTKAQPRIFDLIGSSGARASFGLVPFALDGASGPGAAAELGPYSYFGIDASLSGAAAGQAGAAGTVSRHRPLTGDAGGQAGAAGTIGAVGLSGAAGGQAGGSAAPTQRQPLAGAAGGHAGATATGPQVPVALSGAASGQAGGAGAVNDVRLVGVADGSAAAVALLSQLQPLVGVASGTAATVLGGGVEPPFVALRAEPIVYGLRAERVTYGIRAGPVVYGLKARRKP